MEGFSPGSGGIAGLREDYLGTVEGFSRCLNALTPGGIASVVRGIQDPARDNIKIAATWIEALERNEVKEPGKQIIMARDELAVATLVGESPFSADLVRELQLMCHNMSWDLDWFPGVRPEQTNKIHLLAGPEGSRVSWYYHAMKKILSPEREDFYRKWICNVQPATDDRPFFYDFFRWDALSKLRSVFGPQWPARAEMGFLVLVLATIWTALVAAVLLPGPIIMLRREKVTRRVGFDRVDRGLFRSVGYRVHVPGNEFHPDVYALPRGPCPGRGACCGRFSLFRGVGQHFTAPNYWPTSRRGIWDGNDCSSAGAVRYRRRLDHLRNSSSSARRLESRCRTDHDSSLGFSHGHTFPVGAFSAS